MQRSSTHARLPRQVPRFRSPSLQCGPTGLAPKPGLRSLRLWLCRTRTHQLNTQRAGVCCRRDGSGRAEYAATHPSTPRTRFSGLTSRCTIPLPCRYSSASVTLAAKNLATPSESRCSGAAWICWSARGRELGAMVSARIHTCSSELPSARVARSLFPLTLALDTGQHVIVWITFRVPAPASLCPCANFAARSA
jgi:hypothetical protein